MEEFKYLSVLWYTMTPDNTTIKVSEDIKKELKDLKRFERESYADTLRQLLKESKGLKNG